MKTKKLTAWERVEIARNPKRKTSLDYINSIFDDFIELHGDRNFKDDKAIVCGLAKIGDQNFTIVAEQKGRTTKENIERNFGMPMPDGYRKAVRLAKQAEKFDASLTTAGCEKAAAFVKFCDAFGIPVVSFTNVNGYKATVCEEKSIAVAAAKLTAALANATVA